ncbi:50S ribosomal protein L35, partial [Smittium mucronatum]
AAASLVAAVAPFKTPLLANYATIFSRQMSKLKTHTGAAKRWKRVASGLFKRKPAGKQHLNSKMRSSRRRELGKTVLSNHVQTRALNRLLPY